MRVVVDAAAIALPQEAVPGGDGKAAVHRRCIQGRQHLIDLLTTGERRGALQKHQLRRQWPIHGELLKGMQQGRLGAGGVPGQMLRTPHHLRSMAAGRGGNGVVVSADHHPADPGAGQGRLDAPAHQRNALHLLQVLAGDALRPAAGGNQGQGSGSGRHR